jgi:putative ABC transport system permease protein
LSTTAVRPSRDRSRLRAADLPALAVVGIRLRKMRAALSALGICIGVASIVGIVGITQSSESDLLAEIDRLGTNLLMVENGRTLQGAEARLPVSSTAMIGHLPGVEHVAATALLQRSVYRSDVVPVYETGGIGVRAADASLLPTLDGALLSGTFLNAATDRYPAAVLGHAAAQYLGISHLDTETRVWIGGRWFVVVGILQTLPLAPEIDESVLIGWPVARSDLGFDGFPTRIYVRAATDRVTEVDRLLAASADPQNPEQVAVSRPSDALAARLDVQASSIELVLALGAVALLVGAVGIANVMFVSVLERRGEIGVRRALGAARVHIAAQFLSESVLISSLGGAAGMAAGVAVTAGYAIAQSWSLLIPPVVLWASLPAAMAIGAAAGLYPALRAARLTPTEALRS